MQGFLGFDVKKEFNIIKRLMEGWNYFRETEVVVGITDETSGRAPISNAQLMYIHTNGSPAHNIPPRPVIEPAIREEETKEKIQTLMKDGMKAALMGDKNKCAEMYEKAGMVGRDACKKRMVEGIPPPNKPATIKRKGSSTPLIDTGALMNSITYAVRKKR